MLPSSTGASGSLTVCDGEQPETRRMLSTAIEHAKDFLIFTPGIFLQVMLSSNYGPKESDIDGSCIRFLSQSVNSSGVLLQSDILE
jgi:hypothetical protein